MEDSRLPKAVFYGELKGGSRRVGVLRLRYKEVFKRHLKNTNKRRDMQLWTNKRLRKLEPEPPPTETAYKCETCNRTFKAAIGLSSHLRHGH
eukprot:gene4180-20366_t